ncbi:hypothetical protein QBC43DRAFT_326927 [Cladorrhinum sp. PSN259]|nr:hypothetical protein QBC43DRAFT_326927 [Cladorrhinum sp. PSN259]
MASLGMVFPNAGVEIGTLVKNFDWSKMNVREAKSNDYLHIDVAPYLGTLNKESIHQMDDDLKIMIAGTMKILAKQADKSWNAVLATMMHNQLLQPDDRGEIVRSDKLIKENSSDFKSDGSPNADIFSEVETWFNNLVQDQDVLNGTKIDSQVLANIVDQTGAFIDSFETFFDKNEHHEQTMMDIGVLRFPDNDRPFFNLYRIKLIAWSDCSRIVSHQESKNGINAEFNSCIFRPRKELIWRLSPAARQMAIDAANAIWD